MAFNTRSYFLRTNECKLSSFHSYLTIRESRTRVMHGQSQYLNLKTWINVIFLSCSLRHSFSNFSRCRQTYLFIIFCVHKCFHLFLIILICTVLSLLLKMQFQIHQFYLSELIITRTNANWNAFTIVPN